MSHPTKCRLCGKPGDYPKTLCEECLACIGDIVKRRDRYDHSLIADVKLRLRNEAAVMFVDGPLVEIGPTDDDTQPPQRPESDRLTVPHPLTMADMQAVLNSTVRDLVDHGWVPPMNTSPPDHGQIEERVLDHEESVAVSFSVGRSNESKTNDDHLREFTANAKEERVAEFELRLEAIEKHLSRGAKR